MISEEERFSDLPDLAEGDSSAEGIELRPAEALRSIWWSRRTFLERAGAAGTALALGMLGALPPARRAWASHSGVNGEGYQIVSYCPDYAASHNCLPGCGPSTVYGDACIEAGGHEHYGWHKGSGYSSSFKLRPNECLGGIWDGWLWQYGSPCGNCGNSITRRCHDGYKLISGSWSRSICRWRTACS